MSSREWHYLDPFNQAYGPVSDAQLARVLLLGDCYVWTDGLDEWAVASEVLARGDISPLAESPTTAKLSRHAEDWLDRRRMDRCVHELLGIARGVIADGLVQDAEAKSLQQWLRDNPIVADTWPANVLAQRLAAIFEDGVVDEAERRALLDLLSKVTASRPAVPGGKTRTISLPLSDPAPSLTFSGKTYVLTGEFVFGERARCEEVTRTLGARTVSSVSKKTDFLVIGAIASPHWARGVYGRKIQAGMQLRAEGHPIALVAEEWWARALPARE